MRRSSWIEVLKLGKKWRSAGAVGGRAGKLSDQKGAEWPGAGGLALPIRADLIQNSVIGASGSKAGRFRRRAARRRSVNCDAAYRDTGNVRRRPDAR
jgi:hypothetical protein